MYMQYMYLDSTTGTAVSNVLVQSEPGGRIDRAGALAIKQGGAEFAVIF